MRSLFALALAAAAAAPAAASAQTGSPRFSIEPYGAYGFYGRAGESGPRLSESEAYGARAGLRISPALGLFGSYQRSTPEVDEVGGGEATVDHWSAGVELNVAPRGRVAGIPPILIEAGVGQARYEFDSLLRDDVTDLAVNLGIGSKVELGRTVAIRYGANDYISNFGDGGGTTHQLFVKAGLEFNF
ncbi:MAG TPA: outer membrane beta-barrel protein [Longimicrobium sp.]|nr:outer membrane beta-barrel protein [Longimicrobium sp.]